MACPWILHVHVHEFVLSYDEFYPTSIVFSPVQNYSVRSGTGDFIIALFFLMELTNPFLSMTIILKVVSYDIVHVASV